jgi:hypothetical protein
MKQKKYFYEEDITHWQGELLDNLKGLTDIVANL